MLLIDVVMLNNIFLMNNICSNVIKYLIFNVSIIIFIFNILN